VITHAAGFAYLKSAERDFPETVTLAPWARMEGTFRQGPRTVPNVPLTLYAGDVHSYGEGVPNIFTDHEAITDENGKFVFERAFPGKGRIGRHLILIVGEGAAEATSSLMEPVLLKAGETLNPELGGFGHVVSARLVPPSAHTGKVLWSFAVVDVVADAPEPLRDVMPRFNATVARDGTFRIDDVPPGKYTLRVYFSEHLSGRISDHHFTVPEPADDQARQEIDLGVLTLEGN
jgi:hypothetical protein